MSENEDELYLLEMEWDYGQPRVFVDPEEGYEYAEQYIRDYVTDDEDEVKRLLKDLVWFKEVLVIH